MMVMRGSRIVFGCLFTLFLFTLLFTIRLLHTGCCISPVARVPAQEHHQTSGPPGIAKLGLRLSAGQVSCLASRRMYMYSLYTPVPGERAPAKYLPLQALHASLSTALTSSWNTSSYHQLEPSRHDMNRPGLAKVNGPATYLRCHPVQFLNDCNYRTSSGPDDGSPARHQMRRGQCAYAFSRV